LIFSGGATGNAVEEMTHVGHAFDSQHAIDQALGTIGLERIDAQRGAGVELFLNLLRR
jgi:hypothetical protein